MSRPATRASRDGRSRAPRSRPVSAAYIPRTHPAGAPRSTAPDVLGVLRTLLQIQDKNRANEPGRNKMTVAVLEGFKDRLLEQPKKQPRLVKEIEDVIKQLKKGHNKDMASWLAERLERNDRPGFDLVVTLTGPWPAQVGRTMHLLMETHEALLDAIDNATHLKERVSSIIRNQRGMVYFRPSAEMNVRALHVDFVDGDEEDESVQAQRADELDAADEFVRYERENRAAAAASEPADYYHTHDEDAYRQELVKMKSDSFGSGVSHIHFADAVDMFRRSTAQSAQRAEDADEVVYDLRTEVGQLVRQLEELELDDTN